MPAALHAELTEYTSLLRALRTGATRDVVPLLGSANLTSSAQDSDASESRRASPSQIEPGELSGPPRKRRKTESKSSRWPHMSDDVHVPEWGLEDEITHLISQHTSYLNVCETPDGTSDGDLDDAEVHSQSLASITTLTTSYMSSILALIASHTPPRPQSMQNRISPIDWSYVVDVLSAGVSPDDPLAQR